MPCKSYSLYLARSTPQRYTFHKSNIVSPFKIMKACLVMSIWKGRKQSFSHPGGRGDREGKGSEEAHVSLRVD